MSTPLPLWTRRGHRALIASFSRADGAAASVDACRSPLGGLAASTAIALGEVVGFVEGVGGIDCGDMSV
jgi:hypothetical protein